MLNFLLKLENNKKLRLLPISEDTLYLSIITYYISDIKKTFICNDTNFIDFNNRDKVSRFIKYYIPVEYNDEIYFIKFGRKIQQMINDLVSKKNLNYLDFLNNEIQFNVNIKDVYTGIGLLQNFDECLITINDNSKYWNMKHNDLGFFNSKRYTDVYDLYKDYIKRLKIENQSNLITYLNDNNLLKPEYNYLLRNIKINQFRENKINTTKTKLWNKVDSFMCDADINKHIENIGYSKNEKEVHQFMVDGYLFEIKMIDDI